MTLFPTTLRAVLTISLLALTPAPVLALDLDVYDGIGGGGGGFDGPDDVASPGDDDGPDDPPEMEYVGPSGGGGVASAGQADGAGISQRSGNNRCPGGETRVNWEADDDGHPIPSTIAWHCVYQ